MQTRRIVRAAVVTSSLLMGAVLFSHFIFAASVTSTLTAIPAPFSLSSVTVNGGASIVLTPNTTTNVDVSATLSGGGSCFNILSGTTTILLYRSGITSSTCAGSLNNLNCYTATAFTASSSCSSGAVNTTTTFGIFYYAQPTDASSAFSAQNWIGTVKFTNSVGATTTLDSAGQELLTLTAINVGTSSINYGNVAIGSDTGSTNQLVQVQNVGNSSTTLLVSGTALANGTTTVATSFEHYATTTFTFGGSEQVLSGSATLIPAFSMAPQGSVRTLYWGLSLPGGTATGAYTGTVTFASQFTP